eukprot:SAG31_NODE_16832_length_694_cov_0.652101_1_plen_88_part_01
MSGLTRSQFLLSLTIAFLLGAYVSQQLTGKPPQVDAEASANLIKELIRQQQLISSDSLKKTALPATVASPQPAPALTESPPPTPSPPP